jgi:hypothetical protein
MTTVFILWDWPQLYKKVIKLYREDPYFVYRFHRSALNGNRCAAGSKAHMNFADQSACQGSGQQSETSLYFKVIKTLFSIPELTCTKFMVRAGTKSHSEANWGLSSSSARLGHVFPRECNSVFIVVDVQGSFILRVSSAFFVIVWFVPLYFLQLLNTHRTIHLEAAPN